MRAIFIAKAGGPEVLELRDAEKPAPAEGEVLVRVHAAGVNRADVLQRMGKYPAPPGVPADIPGLEYAGEVTALGAGVTRWKAGDRLMGLVAGGAYAEFVVTHEDTALAIPRGWTYDAAGAVPEVFLTAYDALIRQVNLAAGDVVLIHAVGSGVGTAALQIAKAFGATVIGTSRSAAKLKSALPLGLDVAVDTSRERFGDAVARATAGRGVDVVLDLIGGALFNETLATLTDRGRLILVGLTAGRS
ncbi:MAG: zinc-binding dehydrogenase, partial [Gemmatimonadales bacterium]|nr:zinc-binding dehydrogenase [Gemmatimonadales bacterium]